MKFYAIIEPTDDPNYSYYDWEVEMYRNHIIIDSDTLVDYISDCCSLMMNGWSRGDLPYVEYRGEDTQITYKIAVSVLQGNYPEEGGSKGQWLYQDITRYTTGDEINYLICDIITLGDHDCIFGWTGGRFELQEGILNYVSCLKWIELCEEMFGKKMLIDCFYGLPNVDEVDGDAASECWDILEEYIEDKGWLAALKERIDENEID